MLVKEFCVVLTTFSDDEVGEAIIHSLLNKHLAACIQVQSIDSYYHWKGKVQADKEKLVVIKTTHDKYSAIEADILANHNYETPEIICLPIVAGYPDYLEWVRAETHA
ncbi:MULTISPECIES: divalent-cation tolerance protein CutA [Photobacterium]|uniref:Cytochrome C biogenesis protein n=1 Tax=Photobacterium halotolerans TaxID=265726 RepID=A0A0F5VCX2_9GAMM|nr:MULTISPECIES: divalent-cation tolerance protein CutA [Photobacterium]KKC99626.1 cytochrome C biogenesis protein [Photobacterium halotolerans]UIP29922.1 divalent-cation tolerance protein CutA [Photobacterium sp. TLY01]